jgi:hypothetical protein
METTTDNWMLDRAKEVCEKCQESLIPMPKVHCKELMKHSIYSINSFSGNLIRIFRDKTKGDSLSYLEKIITEEATSFEKKMKEVIEKTL